MHSSRAAGSSSWVTADDLDEDTLVEDDLDETSMYQDPVNVANKLAGQEGIPIEDPVQVR